MYEIEVNVNRKTASTRNRSDYAVCDNSDYAVVFHFDDEWEPYEIKTARFVFDGGHTDVVFYGDRCQMPIIHNSGEVEIGVFAGDLHTTTPARLRMMKSVRSASGAPLPPSDDIYDQIMEALESKLTVPPLPEYDGKKYALCIVPNELGTGWEIKWSEVTVEDPSTSNIVGIGKVGFMIIA